MGEIRENNSRRKRTEHEDLCKLWKVQGSSVVLLGGSRYLSRTKVESHVSFFATIVGYRLKKDTREKSSLRNETNREERRRR